MAVLCGGLSQAGQQIGPVKRLRRKFELLKPAKRHGRKLEQLKQKVDLFNFVRESIEREKIKHLFQGEGDMQILACKAWLQRAEKIVSQVNDILKDEGKGSDFNVFFHMKVDEKLTRMHDEIADQLEKSTEMIGASNGINRETNEAAKVEMMPSEGGKLLVSRPKGKVRPDMSSKDKAASEIIHAPAQKYMSVPDLVAAASVTAETEHEIIPLPVTESFPMHETEILPNPADIQETEIVEPYVTRGMPSSRAREIEHVLPEGEEEGQMKPESVSSMKPLISVVKPGTLLFSNKNEENLPIKELKIERHCPIPEDQVSAGPVINSKRSIHHTVEKIIGLMRGGTVSRIGIYGFGGIGKTTILKALLNHTETENMFDSTIWVTVSRHSSKTKIQNQVLKQFSPSGSDTNIEPILHSLENKKILFLLDDVWEGIDLDAAGIPIPSQENGCRIIFTTRSLDVCRIMAADTQLEVKAISREEAWELFHDQVGGIIYSPNIKLYAETIVEECGGLPLTIVVTGSALRKENDVSVWKHALRELLLPGTLGKNGSEAVIQQLKFSYNKLEARDVKDCFLYCASFQEDNEVNISDLVNQFIDEGLVVGNMEDACRRGHDVVQNLLEASLLESTDDELSVKMHDVIRDLASTIMLPGAEGCRFLVRSDLRLTQQVQSPGRDGFMTNKGNQFLFGAGAGLVEPPSNEKWEEAMMIFLMDNELFSLPESPSCPKLLTLFLQRNTCLRAIPVSFFDGMPCLQVLNLSKTRIKFLPQSLSKCYSLKALILRDCIRFSILPPEIGALEHLELLDLRGTDIYTLPNEVGNLACLKHMVISFYGTNNSRENAKLPQTLVADGILSKLLHLNELSIAVYPGDQRWSKSIESITAEMHQLKELEMLEFYFPDVKLLEQFIQESPSWKDEGLTKFRFVVGSDVKRIVDRIPDDVEYDYNQQGRCLIFVNGETLPTAVEEVLSRSTAFYLDHHLNICNLSQFGLEHINALKFLILRECPEIQTVMDGKEVEGSAFPLLEHLSIHFLWKLRRIWEGPVPTGSFSSLRYLSIHTCPELDFVFTCSMVQNLQNLEVLVVEDCEAAQEIIFNDIDSVEILLPKLKKLRLHYLPNLVGIWKGLWPSIEDISFYNCPNLKNLRMSFNVLDTINEIKAEKEWWDELKWDETTLAVQLQAYYTEICFDDL